MHQQQQPGVAQRFQCRVDVGDVGHAMGGIGGGSGRIQFGGDYVPAGSGTADLVSTGFICQIEHHQRFKTGAGRTVRNYAFAISQGLLGVFDRWHQIGHCNGSTEDTGGVRHGMAQHLSIAEMHVPVIGA